MNVPYVLFPLKVLNISVLLYFNSNLSIFAFSNRHLSHNLLTSSVFWNRIMEIFMKYGHVTPQLQWQYKLSLHKEIFSMHSLLELSVVLSVEFYNDFRVTQFFAKSIYQSHCDLFFSSIDEGFLPTRSLWNIVECQHHYDVKF